MTHQMDLENLKKIISDIVNQSIEQASLLFNYNPTFNSVIVSELKKETDPISKLNKLIHIFIEQLTTYQNLSKNEDLTKLQSSIVKMYPRAPKEIHRLLKWIPKKMAKEKQKIDSNQENPISMNINANNLINNGTKEEKMKKEIEQLKLKCSHITNSITSIKESFEKVKETPNNYIDEIKQLKQANLEIYENLANAKMQNKLLKSKISSLKKPKDLDKKTVQTQTRIQTQISNVDEKNDNNETEDKYEVLFYELKTLKAEKERSEKKYLANVEYSATLEEKLRKVQIERDTLQTKLNDQINLMKKKEEIFIKENEKCEKLSQNCLRLETQITKLRDKLNQNAEPYIPIFTNNYNYEFDYQCKSNELKNIDSINPSMINPFEIEFK